jgi:hypothetical protein
LKAVSYYFKTTLRIVYHVYISNTFKGIILTEYKDQSLSFYPKHDG